jgi:hypothetical protein
MMVGPSDLLLAYQAMPIRERHRHRVHYSIHPYPCDRLRAAIGSGC